MRECRWRGPHEHLLAVLRMPLDINRRVPRAAEAGSALSYFTFNQLCDPGWNTGTLWISVQICLEWSNWACHLCLFVLADFKEVRSNTLACEQSGKRDIVSFLCYNWVITVRLKSCDAFLLIPWWECRLLCCGGRNGAQFPAFTSSFPFLYPVEGLDAFAGNRQLNSILIQRS